MPAFVAPLPIGRLHPIARLSHTHPCASASSPRPPVSLLRMRTRIAANSAVVVAERLREELPRIFDNDASSQHYNLFAQDVEFRDPLNSFKGSKRYRSNIAFLGKSPLFCDSSLVVHDVHIESTTQIISRWTLGMSVRALPWRPRVQFTGTSLYELDHDALIIQHFDVWDSLTDSANAKSFSVDAVRDLVKQLRRLPTMPPYELLRRMQTVEIRRYTSWPPNANGAEMTIEGHMPAMGETVAVARVLDKDDVQQVIQNAIQSLEKGNVAKVVNEPFVVQYERSAREVWIPVQNVALSALS